MISVKQKSINIQTERDLNFERIPCLISVLVPECKIWNLLFKKELIEYKRWFIILCHELLSSDYSVLGVSFIDYFLVRFLVLDPWASKRNLFFWISFFQFIFLYSSIPKTQIAAITLDAIVRHSLPDIYFYLFTVVNSKIIKSFKWKREKEGGSTTSVIMKWIFTYYYKKLKKYLLWETIMFNRLDTMKIHKIHHYRINDISIYWYFYMLIFMLWK